MIDRENRKFDMLVRVDTFGDVNGGDFEPGSKAKEQFALVKKIVGAVKGARTGQHPGRDTSMQILLDRIHRDVQNITRTARSIALDEPGFADQFRPPKDTTNLALIVAAEKILEVLWVTPDDEDAVKAVKAALTAEFVAHELPADFVDRLKGDVDAVTKDKEEQEVTREQSVGDTAAIKTLLADGMKAATKLDAIMHNKYMNDSEKLARWRTARHIEDDPKHHSTEPPTPPQPPTP